MNLREETIKVLRAISADREETQASFVGRPILIRNSTLDDAEALLSRLEAGSGEETDATPVLSVRMSATKEELLAALNQEGGDAAVTDRRDEERSHRERSEGSHVATPAPGENSGRAVVERWLETMWPPPRITFLESETLQGLISVAIAAGRRSMREEAAKVVDAEHNRDRDDDEWAAGSRAACVYLADAIRAIPEKQS